MAHIVVRDHSGAVSHKAELKSSLLIGRSRTCDLCLRDVRISREHCRIHHHEGHWVLHDLASRNGTLVNSTPITHHTLREGDIITLGRQSITFHTGPLPRSRPLNPVHAGLTDAEESVSLSPPDPPEPPGTPPDIGSSSTLFATRVIPHEPHPHQ